MLHRAGRSAALCTHRRAELVFSIATGYLEAKLETDRQLKTKTQHVPLCYRYFKPWLCVRYAGRPLFRWRKHLLPAHLPDSDWPLGAKRTTRLARSLPAPKPNATRPGQAEGPAAAADRLLPSPGTAGRCQGLPDPHRGCGEGGSQSLSLHKVEIP